MTPFQLLSTSPACGCAGGAPYRQGQRYHESGEGGVASSFQRAPSLFTAGVRLRLFIVKLKIAEHPATRSAGASFWKVFTFRCVSLERPVREALVAHVGKPELLHSCRLVQPVGDNGAFSSFKA